MGIVSIVISFLAFVAVLLAFAMQQKRRYSGVEYLLVFTSAAGLIIYGYGFYLVDQNIIMTVIKTVLATFNMFLGGDSYNEIKSAWFMKYQVLICLFWIIHITALFVTANAVLATIGLKALRHIRKIMTWLSDEVTLIYGANIQNLQFAKRIKGNIVIVDDKISEDDRVMIEANGWLAISRDREKIVGGIITKINAIKLYCLRDEEELNTEFANKFLDLISNERNENKIGKVSVTILANMAMVDGAEFQKRSEKEGYDSVLIVDRAYLVAKTLADYFPPCKTIEFREGCIAAQDFRVALIGFGKIGQELLKRLYVNGQFIGSCFKAMIFDQDYEKRVAFLKEMNPGMFDNFLNPEINGFAIDAEGIEFYRKLKELRPNYVCVSTGDSSRNRRICNEVMSYFRRNEISAHVCECTYDCVVVHSVDGTVEKKNTFVVDMLEIGRIDSIAMELNYAYLSDQDKENKTKEEAWEELSYFNKMSCRSAADFIPTIKYVISQNAGIWDLGPLSKMEHLRWCAFYFVNGYRTMGEEEFNDRAIKYINGDSGYDFKFHKDEYNHFVHACLIPWEDLPELDAKQNAVFEKKGENRKVNYRENDRKNVEMIKSIVERRENNENALLN